jgi:Zn-dependent M28 family amino/carboxypeptidase
MSRLNSAAVVEIVRRRRRGIASPAAIDPQHQTAKYWEALMKTGRIALLAAFAATGLAGEASARDRINTERLVGAVNAEKIEQHLQRLQRIASRNGNTRALGTPGYTASVHYVVNRMSRAGYRVRVQPFTANLFEENAPPELEQVTPTPTTYVAETDFTTMTYSASSPVGGVTAPLVPTNDIQIPPGPTPSSSNSGCEAADFPAETAGAIALIQRGTCTFEQKAQNAFAAGAVGAIIFNEGQPGRTELLGGTLGNPQQIPVVGTTFALGEDLYADTQAGPVTMRLEVDATTTPVQTWNVLAEKRGKVNDHDVVVGAHLDSVPEGPGINDNGSGTAAILTVAEEISRLKIKPRNTLRFAFWGAEEAGLFGSNHYVATLSDERFENLELNLNFDMVGSRNFVRFVYDGDGDAFGTAGPPGSDVIEEVFVEHFRRRGLVSDPTAFDGRSDYFAFIQAGVPAGGLFSGAEGIKTPREQRRYGGLAGVAYDECYHEACDNILNVNRQALRQFGKAAAHAVLYFGMTRDDIRPPAAAAARVASAAARAADYRGPHLVR